MATEKKEKEVIAKPANCIKCNKRLKRKYWYYRNGGYYCNKRCWKAASNAAKPGTKNNPAAAKGE